MTDHLQINDVVPCVHYLADGVQAAFVYPFAVFKAADLQVWQDGAQVLGGFTVSGVGVSAGGSVLFGVPPAAGAQLTLRRHMALERLSDFQADGIIRAKTLNDELDYQVAAVQQVADDLSRCLRRPFTSTSTADLSLPEPAAGRVLKWNGDGSGLSNSDFDPDTVISGVVAHAQQLASAAAVVAADKEVVVAAAAAAQAAAERAAADADSIGSPLAQGQNLGDLTDVTVARANLGLGAAALCGVGTDSGQVPPAEAVVLRGKHSLWVPAAAMVKHAGSTALDDFNPGANGYSVYKGWSLDAATAEGVCFDLDMPRDWDHVQLDVELLWSVAVTQGGAVRWEAMVSRVAAQGAAPDGWLLDAATLAATASANGVAHSLIRTMLPAVTLPEVADGDIVHLVLRRAAADAGDTLAVDAVLRGAKIRYVTSRGSDD